MHGMLTGSYPHPLGRPVERLEDRTVPAVFTVTTLNDAGAGSLRTAVAQANALAGADQINFAVSGVLSLTGGEINIRDAVSIIGTGTQSLQIDAQNLSRIFNVDNGNGTTFDVLLQGMRLSNGTADFFATNTTEGGIIFNGERLTLSFCELDGGGTASFFTDSGGAIFTTVNTRLAVIDSILRNNVAGFDEGGAIAAVNANVTILRSEVFANTTGGFGDGGAMILNGAGTVCSVIDSYFHDNNGDDGGAIAINGSQLNVSRSLFANNSTDQSFGSFGSGGALRWIGGSGTIQDSTFVGNRAADFGGAIRVLGGASVAIINATITGNTTNSDGDGFGAGAVETSSRLSSAGVGNVTLANTVIAQNFEGRFDASFADVFGPFNAGSFNNFIGQIPLSGESSGLVNGFGGNQIGDFASLNPFLGNLQNNGGRYPSILPLPGSPLIGTGNPLIASPLDQRGFVRGALPVDIGATQTGAFDPNPVTPTPGSPGGVVVPPITASVAVGAGVGGLPQVNVYNDDGSFRGSFLAYERGFTGGVKIARGDVDGDGVLDIITAPGEGGSPLVKVFSGVDFSLIRSFFAFPPLFRGGVNIAAGDADGDGRAEIAVAIASGGAPIVQVYDGESGLAVNAFFAFFNRFQGGVRLAMGDTTGDGLAELVAVPGVGGGPQVRTFNPLTGVTLSSFSAFSPSPGGFFVAVGDLDGDGVGEVVVSLGGGPPVVGVYNANGTQFLSCFFAYNTNNSGGVRVAVSQTSAGAARILTTPGPRVGGAPIRQFLLDGTREGQTVAFAQDFIGGAFVG